MQILYVDGIGGAPVFSWLLRRRLRAHGHEASYFSYKTFMHGVPAIEARLAAVIERMAQQGDYAVIGYSFGGVLSRSVLRQLPPECRPPRHLFLLASPLRSVQLARRFRTCPLFRFLTGDAGQFVASRDRMRAVGLPALPTTCVYGSKPLLVSSRWIGPETSDGMIAESEICPRRFPGAVCLPASHPFLPAHRGLLDTVLRQLAA